MKRVDGVLIVLAVLLAVVILWWAYASIATPAVSYSPSTESRVSIGQTHGLDASQQLLLGIDFGNVNDPVTNQPAADNGPPSQTLYHINRTTNSNIDIIACVKANAPLTNSITTETIPLVGETFRNSSINPPGTGLPEISFTTTNQQTSDIMTAGVPFTYLRFFLDVAAPLPTPGTYNNTITYTSLPVGSDCAVLP